MKQVRNTKQRQIVLNVVQEHHDHPTAEQIFIDVREKDEKISRGTVYRNLHHLAQKNEILHVRIPGADRYDWRIDLHYHLVCTKCGEVSDLALPYNPSLDDKVEEATGYKVERHRTIFEGICPACQDKMD
ncbi:MAG: transcriptional repressor [Clostridia bacterium]|nr:transcriptional repressor [Lachnospiraceae bacterium]NCC00979.1 transcriptional repressor [Clostridia bacterium]NCD03896.1 transcriptional repressor [Clostridia bacterium]